MARVDDYKEAFRLASETLKKINLHRVARHAETEVSALGDGSTEIRVAFLGDPYLIRVGEAVDVLKEGQSGEVSLPEKILLCHYLLNATGEAETGNLITFREIPDGHFYFDAFQRRATIPFLSTFGQNGPLFRECAALLGGQPVEMGDVGMSFRVLPRISVQLVLWEGDEEFSPEASILFDATIQRFLPVEDVAVVSGMLVYRLMGLARSRNPGR